MTGSQAAERGGTFQASQQAVQFNAPGGAITINQVAGPPVPARSRWLAPPLAAGMVDRPDVSFRLLEMVCADTDDPVSITGLHGTGGFGKTTLATWICHQPEVRRRFPGGLLWVTLGERAASGDLAAKVNDLVEQLTGSRPAFTDPLQAGMRLGEALDAHAGPVLVVVDDVWSEQQVEPFLCGGRGCRRLLTTRHRRLVDQRNRLHLDQMTVEQAAAVLSRDVRIADRGVVDRVLAATGRWPVLLALANRALVRMVDYGATADQALREITDRLTEEGPGTFDLDNVHHRKRAVAATIRAGLDLLPPETADRFFEMAIFSEDADVPLAVLHLLWGATARLTQRRVRTVCESLADLALVQDYRHDTATVRLHDVIRAYLLHEANPPRLTTLHERLLDAAAQSLEAHEGTRPWWDLPPQYEYLVRYLTDHLAGAGRHDELASTVTDLRWITQRLQRYGAAAAEADLAAAHTDVARFLGRKLRQNAHLLTPITPEHALPAILVSRLDNIATLQSTIRNHLPHLSTPRVANRWPLPDLPHPALNRTFTGHSDRITALAVAPDTAWIATGGADANVRVWDPATGACRHTLTGHTSEITSLVVSGGGRRLISASADNTLRAWDLATGTCHHVLRGHAGPVTALAVPATRDWVASASHDRTVRMWNVATGTCDLTFGGHTDRLTALAVSSSGGWLASAGQDDTIRIWDTTTGECRNVLTGHTNWIATLAFSPDDTWLATAGGDSTVRIWDLDSGTSRHTLTGHIGIVSASVTAPDGSWLATASHDNTIRLWDPNTGAGRHVLSGHTDCVAALAVLPGNPPRLATTGHDRTVRIWNTTTGQCEATYTSHTDRITTLAAPSNGRWLVSAAADHTTRTWDPSTPAQDTSVKGHESRINALVAAPTNNWLASASDDFTVRIWDQTTGACQHILGDGSPVYAIAAAPDGTWIAAAGVSNTHIWDTRTGTCRHKLKQHHDIVRTLAIAPDGTWLATGSADTTIRIWDPHTGNCRYLLQRHHSAVGRLAVSPHGDWLASGAIDGTIHIWDPTTGQHRRELQGHQNWIGWPVPAPDGSWLATASGDLTVRIWNPNTGECRHVLTDHPSWISGLAVAPDGTWLVSASSNGPIRLWDLTTAISRHTLTSHPTAVTALTVAPNGTWLAAVTNQGTITIWHPDNPHPIAAMRVDAALTTCIALPDNRGLTAGSAGGAIYTFDVITDANQPAIQQKPALKTSAQLPRPEP